MANWNLSTIGKYIPLLAILYSIYQAYGQRGIEGVMQDLKDVPNIIKYKEDMIRIVVGVAIVVGGSVLVKKFVPAGILRYIMVGVVYLMGSQMIMEALSSGRSGPIGFFGSGPTPAVTSGNALQGMN